MEKKDFWYVVGLIATDGSLSKSGRHIDFTSADYKLVKLVQIILNKNHLKIGRKYSGDKRSSQYRLQIGDIKLYRKLENIGLHPNKSKSIGPLDIPHRQFSSFLRGCFDGDGSIWSHWDKRWPNSFIFYVCISSASPKFLEWLRKKINDELSISGSLVKTKRSTTLRYAKKESRILLRYIYSGCDKNFLQRKRDKVIEILRQDTYNNQELEKFILSASAGIGRQATLRT